jgi:hypothetical protein
LPTINLYNAYEPGDQRREGTLFDPAAYAAANPQYNVTFEVAPYENTGYYSQKYQPRKGQTSGQPELNYLNNFRTIRYAEVLLMAAEAYNQTGNDAMAQQYLNQVRRRAFMVTDASHDITSTGSNLYTDIINERRLELAMEGDRFFDLVRTGLAPTVLGPLGFTKGKNEVFPIPTQEVTVSHLTQNPGY